MRIVSLGAVGFLTVAMIAGEGRAEFVLDVQGQAGTPFTAIVSSAAGDTLDERRIDGTVPARYAFDASGLHIRLTSDPEGGGRIHAVLLENGRAVSQASGSGSGVTLLLQSGSGLPAESRPDNAGAVGWGGGGYGSWSGGSGN